MALRRSESRGEAALQEEVLDWMVLLQSGDATEEDWRELKRWRALSQAHEAAWQRAETMLNAFRQVPARLGRETLGGVQRFSRRRALRSMAWLALAMPAYAVWRAPWREWTADLRTAVGERMTADLADGTRVVLNTDSAVDVSFTAGERSLRLLAGEILITTARDPAPVARPFIVQTAHGRLQALGTRFSVRDMKDAIRLGVYEGAVAVSPADMAQGIVVRAGEQTTFSRAWIQPSEPAEDAFWEQGMILAQDMRLADLVAELDRYQRGGLRCDPAVGGLAVSGAFPTGDIEASLALLEKSLPVRVSRLTDYWITLLPR